MPPHKQSAKQGVRQSKIRLSTSVNEHFSPCLSGCNNFFNFFQPDAKRLSGNTHFTPRFAAQYRTGKCPVCLVELAQSVVDAVLFLCPDLPPIAGFYDAFSCTGIGNRKGGGFRSIDSETSCHAMLHATPPFVENSFRSQLWKAVMALRISPHFWHEA